MVLPARAGSTAGSERPALAGGPITAASLAVAVVLTVTSDRYGYHRDELYFRMLRPAWGYLDQPPLTPLIAHATAGLVNQPWALRLPGTVASAVTVAVLALITRELGGDRLAQVCVHGATHSGNCRWRWATHCSPPPSTRPCGRRCCCS